MKSIILVAISNIRKRKRQNLLVGLSIFLSVLMLTTAVGILGGIHKPFDVMFDRLKASHILLYYDIRQNDSEEIKNWFQKQAEFEFIGNPQNFYTVSEPLIFHNEKIDIMVRITEFNKHQSEYDQLIGLENNEELVPGWGETWIPRHMAERYNIKIGDTLKIPLSNGLYPLSVSSIIIDPHYASGLINPNRIWIASGMLPFMVKASELNKVMQGIRLKKKTDIDNIWARFNSEMSYSGSNLQYSLFKSVFTGIYKIIGLVIIVFSVLAIFISCYIISSVIASSVLADARLTGVLKALGYKPMQVAGIYITQYLLLILFFIPMGLIASYFSIHAILQSLLKSIGLLNFNFPLFYIFLVCALIFVVLILGLVFLFSRKAAKIPPAQALKMEVGDANIHRLQNRFQLSFLNFNLPFWIALKMIFDNPRKSILSIFSIVFTVFILGFSINISNSFNKMNEHKSAWGFDNSDLQVHRSTNVILPIDHTLFVSQIQNKEEVTGIVPFNYYEVTVPQPISKPPFILNGKVFESSPDKIGLLNIEGKHPGKESEISLCIGTARKLQKNVGDSVSVLIENEPREFLVCGIYQDISNLGEGFRMSNNAVKAVNPIFEPDRYAIKLSDKGKIESFKKALLKKYGETLKIELTIEEQLGFMGITKSINASMILISLFFLGVLIVSILNDVFLNVWENRKSIGIYKMIGFAPFQLQLFLVWKTILLTLAGTVIGIPLVIFLGSVLISSITSGFGVVQFPFVFSVAGILITTVLLFIVTAFSAYWSSGSIKQINARILVNE